MKEIERKFLVTSDDWRDDASSGTLILQAYLAASDGNSARVRILGDGTATLAIKTGIGMVRDEFEYPIPVADARRMMESRLGHVIDKTRHLVAHAGFVWEVDVYHDGLDGLVVAEVEMASEHDRPPLPEWVGREVTGEARYSNTQLALTGNPAG